MNKTIRHFVGAICLLPTTLLVSACVDNRVDYGDVDMKMRVNVDGLAVKFGNTEKIMLADILEVDGSMKTDQTQLYYLEESGSTSINFEVAKVSSEVDVNRMNVRTDFGAEVIKEIQKRFSLPSIPKNFEVPAFIPEDYVPFNDEREFHLSLNFGDDVKKLTEVDLEEKSFTLDLVLNDDAAAYLAIYSVENIVVTLPNYIVAEGLNEKNQYILPEKDFGPEGTRSLSLGEVKLKGLKFAQGITNTTVPAENYGISGKLKMGVKEPFVLNGTPKATISLVVEASNHDATVAAKSVTGVFNPTIDPTVNPVDVKASLPEFLQDGETRFTITNPTLRFDADLTQTPASIRVKNAQLTSTLPNGSVRTATLAAEGVKINHNSKSTVYFYEGETPYDPEKVSNATLSKATLSTLIENLPDQIGVKLDNGAVTLTEDPVTIEMGKEYQTAVDYKFMIPFVFKAGLKLNYNEKSEPININLDDLENESVTLEVKANVFSTIPLALNLSVHPLDEKGNDIEGITVSSVDIKAGNDQGVTTPITLKLSGSNKKLFQVLDRIKFSLQAKTGEDIQNAALRSSQYIQITDGRIHLKGSVIGDFN